MSRTVRLLILLISTWCALNHSPATASDPAPPSTDPQPISASEQELLAAYYEKTLDLLHDKEAELAGATSPSRRDTLQREVAALVAELHELDEVRHILTELRAAGAEPPAPDPEDDSGPDRHSDILEQDLDQRFPDYAR